MATDVETCFVAACVAKLLKRLRKKLHLLCHPVREAKVRWSRDKSPALFSVLVEEGFAWNGIYTSRIIFLLTLCQQLN